MAQYDTSDNKNYCVYIKDLHLLNILSPLNMYTCSYKRLKSLGLPSDNKCSDTLGHYYHTTE